MLAQSEAHFKKRILGMLFWCFLKKLSRCFGGFWRRTKVCPGNLLYFITKDIINMDHWFIIQALFLRWYILQIYIYIYIYMLKDTNKANYHSFLLFWYLPFRCIWLMVTYIYKVLENYIKCYVYHIVHWWLFSIYYIKILRNWNNLNKIRTYKRHKITLN